MCDVCKRRSQPTITIIVCDENEGRTFFFKVCTPCKGN